DPVTLSAVAQAMCNAATLVLGMTDASGLAQTASAFTRFVDGLASLPMPGPLAGTDDLQSGGPPESAPVTTTLARSSATACLAARLSPPSYSQERLWTVEQLYPGTSLYNIPSAIRIPGPLDVQALKRSINEVVRRHEALRATFREHDGQPVQAIAA